MGLITLDKLTLLKELFPINMTQYWFIRYYFILYCISPFLNKLISSLNKREFQKLLLVGFIVISIIPTITHQGAFENNGYTLYNFIYLYFFGGYLRDYPLDKSYIFNPLSKSAYQIALILIFIFSFSIRYIAYYYADSIFNISPIYTDLSVNIKSSMDYYSSPLLLLQSISYFALFTSFTFKSRIINKISPLVLGVYLIHSNSYLRGFLFKWIKIDNGPVHSSLFLINIIIATIIIFVVCLLIEYLRQLLFKFIYDRKISKKIRDKYYAFIYSVHAFI